MTIVYIAGLVLAFYMGVLCFSIVTFYRNYRQDHTKNEEYIPYCIYYTINGIRKSILLDPDTIDNIQGDEDVELIVHETIDRILHDNPNVSREHLREEITIDVTDIILKRGFKCT